MPILALWSDKGGPGKTTLAVATAHHFNLKLMDADPQRDSIRWATAANWPCERLSVRSERDIQALADAKEWFVVDCPPGREEDAARKGKNEEGVPIALPVLLRASAVVIPTKPGKQDMVALGRALKIVQELRTVNGKSARSPRLGEPMVVLNQAKKSSRTEGLSEAMSLPGKSYIFLGTIGHSVVVDDVYDDGRHILDVRETPGIQVRRVMDNLTASLQEMGYKLKVGR